MRAINFKQANTKYPTVIKRFGGKQIMIPALKNQGLVTTVWKAKFFERIKFLFTGKLYHIQSSVSAKVEHHFSKANISPKWGSGTEGMVVHPSASNPESPRFKVTSAAFKAYKADPNNRFKK